MHPLHSFFYPQVIAVIGASDRYGSAGRTHRPREREP